MRFTTTCRAWLPWSLLSALSLAVLAACGGSSVPGSDDDAGPTNPPGPGSVTITSWSPDAPYWGDELVLEGSGFSPIPAENHVWFPKGAGSCGSNVDTTAAVVLAASATQLRVRVPYNAPPLTQAHPQNCGVGRIRVIVGDAMAQTPLIDFEVPPRIRGWRSPDGTNIGRAEWSVELQVDGLDPVVESNVITINGAVVPPSPRSQNGPIPGWLLGDVEFTIPSVAAPGIGGVSALDTVTVQVTVAAKGRTARAPLLLRRYAPVHVDSVRVVLVPQATPGAPDSPEFTVWVRNLYGPVEHVWTRFGSTTNFRDTLAIDGIYSGPLTFGPPPGTTSGNYSVRLRLTRFGSGPSYDLGNATVP